MAVVIQTNTIGRPPSWQESLSITRPFVTLTPSQSLNPWITASLTRASTAPVSAAGRVFTGPTPTYTSPAPVSLSSFHRAATVAVTPQLLRQSSQTVQVAKPDVSGDVGLHSSVAPSLDVAFAESLNEFLKQRDLQQCAPALEEWCLRNGAAFMEEVLQNLDDIAEALGLSAHQKARLLHETPVPTSSGQAAGTFLSQAVPKSPAASVSIQPVTLRSGARTTSTLPLTSNVAAEVPQHRTIVAPSASRQWLDRTRTNPSTQQERQVASQRVETSSLPLANWAALAAYRQAPLASPGHSMAAATQQASAPQFGNNLVMYTPADAAVEKVDRAIELRATQQENAYQFKDNRRYSYLPQWIMNARIPTATELQDPFSKEKQEDMELRGRRQPQSFEAVRSQFLQEHGNVLKRELGAVFDGPITIKPAAVSSEVKERFLTGVQADGRLLAGYHGSNAENYASICDRGLLIPKSTNGLTVVNGSVHGKGIYTARVGAPELSRGFCSEPRMLVCGVVSNALDTSSDNYCGRFQVTAQSNAVKHVGDAMVVFDEKRVAPLYEVSASDWHFRRSRNGPPNSGAQTVVNLNQWVRQSPKAKGLPGDADTYQVQTKAPSTVYVGGHKVMHPRTNQVAFVPPEPEGWRFDILHKRVLVRKAREKDRTWLRQDKAARLAVQ
eukprot:TRINITY_DN14517_c0_g2_i1.p1 TRINITY_DN14517_c0_g2~~TRINITY_DN14517_c0_g2_i1.p1  ORF type:complete len:669 (+),score=49.58 TRINITY_DN14517_c0_g2_i1:57-2063(+)